MIGTRINDRYRIDSEHGHGGMGTVYKGFDTTLERDVAIKMITETRLGTEGRNRLLQEAKAIAQLSHPNIVTVFDAGEYKKSPFIVMEYVEGVNLYQQPPENIEEIVASMQQVCAALSHAHEQGIIHRDLKPENVILTTDGTVKLMDFGLARSVSSRLTSEGTIIGTVFYLAPEQAQGQPVDPRSDLYSLGVMLYELATRELPFTAGDPLAVVSQHIHAPVVPPRAKNEHIPPALEALILGLMEKDPKDRPASAKDVLAQLSAPEILDADALPVVELSVLDRIVRGRLVGREPELKKARQAWQQAMTGQGQLLLVSGEPGVGKTRLMREVVTQAEVSGGQAYIGESQAEGNAPYAAFAQIIRRALRANRNNGLELPNLVLAELISIAPELQIIYPNVHPNPALEPESEQRRLFECLITFFSTLCSQSPLLLVLEDIHWADSGTLSLLQFLARRCREHHVMLLGTYREVELDEALPFHQTLLDLNRKNLGSRLKLERLDEDRTRDMLTVIFAEEIRPDFLAGIYRETEGNPFFIEEVCKALIDSGKVYFDGEIWQRPPDMTDMEVPQSIKVAVQSRVRKLDESAQEVLLTAAVIGREFSFELLQKVTEKKEGDLIVSLESALKAQLIEELREAGGDQFIFSHALIPAALRESLSGMRRTRLHRRVAQMMEEVMPDAYQRLAYHWGESGNEVKGLEYIIKAAERAKQTYAYEDAIKLYSEGLVFLDNDDERRFDLLRSKVELFNLIGDRDSQRVEIEAMLELAGKQKDQVKQVDALHALVELYLQIDLAKVREPAERAYNIAKGLEDVRRIARSSYLIGKYYSMDFFHLNRALPHMQEAVELARSLDSKDDLLIYLSELARIYGNQRNAEAAISVSQEAVSLSKQVNNKRLELIATKSLLAAHFWQKNYEMALPISQTALQLAREIGDISSELDVLNVYGLNLAGLKRWKEAEAVFLKMIEGFDLFIFHSVLKAVNSICETQVELGEYEKYHYLIRDLMEKAKQAGNQHMYFKLKGYYSLTCFWLGRYAEYQKGCEEIWPYVDTLDDQATKVNTLYELVFSSGLVGDLNLAYEYLDKYRLYFEDLEDIEDFYHQINFSMLNAEIALLDGNISALELGLEHINRGIALWQQHPDEIDWFAYYLLAGLHLALAEEDSGHVTEALLAIELALKTREERSGLDSSAPLEPLYTMAWRVYYANNQPEKADEYLHKGYERVMMVAGKIQNDELRKSFMGNVPYNREIVEEAKVRGIAKD